MMSNVNISKADNGYVVSCYGEEGEKKVIAKTMEEAMEAAEKMMGSKMKKENYKDVKEKTVAMAMRNEKTKK